MGPGATLTSWPSTLTVRRFKPPVDLKSLLIKQAGQAGSICSALRALDRG